MLLARDGNLGGTPCGESGRGAARDGAGGGALPMYTDSRTEMAFESLGLTWLFRFGWGLTDVRLAGSGAGGRAKASSSSLPIKGLRSASGDKARGGVFGGVGVLCATPGLASAGIIGNCFMVLGDNRGEESDKEGR